MRKIFAKIHLWLSIPFGIIIAIACFTGAILVFEDELLELSHPSRYFVEEVKEKPLSPEVLMSLARKQLPDSIKITGIRVTADPQRTYELVLPGKKAAAFINPYTGEVKGMDDGQGFFMQVMRLHRWLLTYKRDGSFSLGKELMGYATLFFVFIIISGLFIWFPRSKKALKSRLKIKMNAGWFRFFYDLHAVGGFYAALLLLVLSLTGLTWSFGWYRDVFYAAFGVEQTPQHAPAPASQQGDSEGRGKREGRSKEEVKGNTEPSSKGDVKDRHKEDSESQGRSGRKQQEEKKINYIYWEDVLASLKDRYTDFNSITIQDGTATVSTAKYGNTRGSDRLTFDNESGKIIGEQLYKDLPKSGKIRGWIYSVHVGSWGGLTTRILSCLVSFLGGVFVITGYYFWIKKAYKKRLRKKQKQSSIKS